MVRRIVAITFIFVCSSIAWAILGATVFHRTYSVGAVNSDRVSSTWGTAQNQTPPHASYTRTVSRNEESTENGKRIQKVIHEKITQELPIESSGVVVDLDLEHRQKGLLWYSTYRVRFNGVYEFRNTSEQDESIDFVFKLPTNQAVYDDLKFTVDGASVPFRNEGGSANLAFRVPAGKHLKLNVAYRSQGLNEWRYSFGSAVTQVRDFTLRMNTNFKDIDFPDNTISPSEKMETADGWDLTWKYDNLLSGYQIAMTMPEKLQPGPLAGRISFFAPVSLFFFFFVMLIITTIRGIELHPMNYFFIAAAFLAFHLLLAYLVDHVSIHVAFAISSVVSIFLVVTYLRLVVGMRFASREAALAQFVYLVAFSYAFFLEGFTGLAVTVGSIVTLFVAMQVTGRIRWAERFALPPPETSAGQLD